MVYTIASIMIGYKIQYMFDVFTHRILMTCVDDYYCDDVYRTLYFLQASSPNMHCLYCLFDNSQFKTKETEK